MIIENYREVEEKVKLACKKSNRKFEDVTLVAVSKTKPMEMIEELYSIGVRDFGENKPQEIRDKFKALPKDIKWHMIGNLQTNKIKYVIENCELIHSIDSLKLAEALEKEAIKKECEVNILIQVNNSGEISKSGFSVEELYENLEKFSEFERIHVKGLMTIAPYVDDPEENREIFSQLYKVFIDIKGKNNDNIDMDYLSMGMTNDYEVAIEEGATHVRVGTGIFGARNYNR